MANEKKMAQFVDEKVRPIVETTIPGLIKQLDDMVERIEAIETKACDCGAGTILSSVKVSTDKVEPKPPKKVK